MTKPDPEPMLYEGNPDDLGFEGFSKPPQYKEVRGIVYINYGDGRGWQDIDYSDDY